jgi:hypothetical protein
LSVYLAFTSSNRCYWFPVVMLFQSSRRLALRGNLLVDVEPVVVCFTSNAKGPIFSRVPAFSISRLKFYPQTVSGTTDICHLIETLQSQPQITVIGSESVLVRGPIFVQEVLNRPLENCYPTGNGWNKHNGKAANSDRYVGVFSCEVFKGNKQKGSN